MKDGILHTTLVKRGEKLIHTTGGKIFQEFEKSLQEGQRVDVFFEVLGDNYTLGQLAKVHKCIRTLAGSTGDSFQSMKLEVKTRSGIAFRKEIDGEKYMIIRSFSDCSAEELSLAIEAAIEIGDSLGINLR